MRVFAPCFVLPVDECARASYGGCMFKIALLAILAVTGCAGTFGGPAGRHRAATWTTRGLMIEAEAAELCDRGQTLYMADGGAYDRTDGHARLVERDPVLGTNPSPGKIDAAFVVAMVGIAAIEVLPRKAGLPVAAVIAGVETISVVRNAREIRATGARGFCGGR